MYKKLCIGLVSVIIIILIIDICQVDGKGGRGGGSRGGSRGSRGRSFRFGGSRNGVTARKGSSPYTRSNFRRALSTGYIYGSVRYMRTRRYKTAPDEVPAICTNNNDTDSNGTTYGYFICPRAGEPENFEYCCGDEKRERCCANSDSTGSLLGIVFGIIGGVVGIAVISVCCFTCCGNSKENLGNKFTTPNERPSNIDEFENSNKQTVDTEAGATNKTDLTTTSELGQTLEISKSTELDSTDCNNDADEKSSMNEVLDDRMTSIPCTIPYPENHSESITYPTHPEELSSPPVSPSMTTPYLLEQSTTYPPASTTTSITTPYPPEQSYSNTESEPTDITSHQPPLDSLSSDGNAYPLASITTPYPPEQSDLSAYLLSPSAPYSIDPTSVYTPSTETESIETENTEPKREFSPPPYSEIENPTST